MAQSTRESTKSSRPSSAQWRSSKTRTVGRSAASPSTKRRQAANASPRRSPPEVSSGIPTSGCNILAATRSPARCRPARPLAKLRLRDLSGVALENPGLCLDHLAEGPVAHAFAIGKRASLAPAGQLGLGLDPSRQLLHEPALPHSRNTHDRHELRLALGARAVQRVEQLVELAAATDEPDRRLQVDVDTEQRARCHRLPGRHGLLFSFATTASRAS